MELRRATYNIKSDCLLKESLYEWLWNLDSTTGRLPLGWWLNLIRVFISQCAVSYAHWQSALKTATMHTVKLIQVVHVQWKYNCCRPCKYLWKVLSTVNFHSGQNIYKKSTLIKWSHQPMSILQLVLSRSQTLLKKLSFQRQQISLYWRWPFSVQQALLITI